jgi:hypothetical protein
MQRTIKQQKDFNAWHAWFAWRPVQVGDKRVWLERILRRSRVSANWNGSMRRSKFWEYAMSEFDLLKDPTQIHQDEQPTTPLNSGSIGGLFETQ